MDEIKTIEPKDITDYFGPSYLDYSMYVIMDRSLPRIEDGLKPVQRRIVYAMNALGLDSGSKYKKSARTIGDVLGKYHPHGDSACYEAMVIMAQPFNFLTPLVDGQGNWGSQDDPKSFAAMRYTEAKLTPYSKSLLDEIKQDTVPFMNNFDGTMQEPRYLPSQVPNILLNHTTGVAVGMSTEMPSHNLIEVVEATSFLIDNPKASTRDLMKYLKGPDLATGGIITSSQEDLHSIYDTGMGSFRVRAKYHVECGRNIVITELPFRVQGTKVIERVAELMSDKKLLLIEDIRDESDHENPVRLVFTVKKNSSIDIEKIVNHLFSVTDLETSMRVEFRFIDRNNTPGCKPLIPMLNDWIDYRKDAVVRRLNYQLNRIKARIHLVEGLIIAFLNIDEVIRIIRQSDDPKEELMKAFSISQIQAEYILDTKLSKLARIEQMNLEGELDKLKENRDKIEKVLSSPARINTQIKRDMKRVADEYGVDRKSRLEQMNVSEKINESDLIPSEDVMVVLSSKGWIRSGKGYAFDPTALSYKAGDSFSLSLNTQSNQETILIDETGRSFLIQNTVLPTARSLGDPLTRFITPDSMRPIVSMFSASETVNRIILSKSGYGYIAEGDGFYTRQKKGKVVFTDNKTSILPLKEAAESEFMAIVTKMGQILIFKFDELPVLKKGKGNKLIGLSHGDEVVDYCLFSSGDNLLITGDGKEERWTAAKMEPYFSVRGRKGKKAPRTFGSLASIKVTD